MRQRAISLLTTLLALLIASCVSIPQQTEIVRRDCNQHELQTVTTPESSPFTASSLPAALPVSRIDAENFSVLNWNIYKGQMKNWEADLLRLSADQDIVLLQEASLNEELQKILSERGLCWWLNNAFIYRGVETGVMMASKVQPLNSYGLRHVEPLIRTPKTTLINRYPLTGTSRTLLVANIHSINFTLGTAAYQNQLDEMRKILSNHDGPLIVAGDFNNWSDERTSRMNEMADALSLVRLDYDSSDQTRVFGEIVDHIFYRGLEPLSRRSIDVSSSDHNPITVQFRVTAVQIAELRQ